MLNRVFRNSNWAGRPNTIYIGLLTSPPTSNDGTGATEVPFNAATGYQRVPVTTASLNTAWIVGTGTAPDNVPINRYCNADPIIWPKATASWGAVTHIAIYSTANTASMLMWMELPGGVAVNIDAFTVFRLESYKCVIALDPAYVGDVGAIGLLGYFLKNGVVAVSSPLSLALSYGTTNLTLNEIPSGGGYVRKTFPTASAQPFISAVSGKSYNSLSIDFATSTAAWNSSQPITHWAILNGTGQIIFHGPLSESFVVSTTGITMGFVGGEGSGLEINMLTN